MIARRFHFFEVVDFVFGFGLGCGFDGFFDRRLGCIDVGANVQWRQALFAGHGVEIAGRVLWG